MIVTRRRTQWANEDAHEYAKRMRRKPTKAERRFKRILRSALNAPELCSGLGKRKIKYNFQKIFMSSKKRVVCIVDFYVPDLELVFEVDGGYHDRPDIRNYDAKKVSFLATRGIKVVRVRNEDTRYENRHRCLAFVKGELMKRLEQLRERRMATENRKRVKVDRKAEIEAVERYLKEGGRITKCPPKRRLFGFS